MNPAADAHALISQLFVYPIKSCAGIAVSQVRLLATGLEYDRAWMLVDAQGQFVSQRELPRMVLVQPVLQADVMLVRAPGMVDLRVQLENTEQPPAVSVQVWKDRLPAWDAGAAAAQWFSEFLGQPLRLVRFDPAQRRLSSRQWTGDTEALNQFSDGYPVLVLSEASLAELNSRLLAAGEAAVTMARFRPNIVLSGLEAHDEDRLDELHIAAAGARLRLVKPCPRCPIPNIDPQTATSSPAVGDTLQGYRQTAVVGGAVAFGMNAIVLDGAGQTLAVGQEASADYRFD